MRDTVLIAGSGQLAELVSKEMSGSYKIIRKKDLKSSIPKSAKLCLLLYDEYRPAELTDIEKVLRKQAIRWLNGVVVFDEGVVGPWSQPGRPGCFHCAMRRKSTAEFDREDRIELQMDLMRYGVIKRDRSVLHGGLVQMGYLIVEEVHRVMQGKPSSADGRLYLMDLKTLNVSLHAFLPDPLCEVCGGLPDDTPEAARIALQPNPKSDIHAFRCKPLGELENVLHSDYVDGRTGLMKQLTLNIATPFCDVVASLPAMMGIELTAGRSHRYKQSGLTAILEGLERYCGMMPRGKRTCINDSYANLSDIALDPATVGLYSEEQYASPDFPYEPFDAEEPMRWIWAYSFKQERPILIPEQLAYYGSGFGSRLVSEGSNGCALGSSLEEAILYGMMEVVERDSFLLTWYARLPVSRLDPLTVPDTELRLMIHRLENVAGYGLFLFNITMENGIPSILAVAKNKKKTGANLICSAGAHPDPIRAAKSAIFELAAHSPSLDYMYEHHREEYVGMLEDPYLVSEMPDHAFLYTVPEAEERLHFLLNPDRPSRTFSEAFGHRSFHSDLTDDLKPLLQQFRRLNMDVIVVDQSTSETVRNGLHCVKVIIPGMLPMSFGHHLRRVTGLERVLNVPMELGFSPRPLTPAELNPHPHPFL